MPWSGRGSARRRSGSGSRACSRAPRGTGGSPSSGRWAVLWTMLFRRSAIVASWTASKSLRNGSSASRSSPNGRSRGALIGIRDARLSGRHPTSRISLDPGSSPFPMPSAETTRAPKALHLKLGHSSGQRVPRKAVHALHHHEPRAVVAESRDGPQKGLDVFQGSLRRSPPLQTTHISQRRLGCRPRLKRRSLGLDAEGLGLAVGADAQVGDGLLGVRGPRATLGLHGRVYALEDPMCVLRGSGGETRDASRRA